MNNKDKGNIGEAIAIAEFTKRNIQVSIPFGDNARYDLIADFNGKLNRIQVKYCNQKITNNDSIRCPCASSTNHTTNKKCITYQGDIDYFVFYLVEWNEILIIDIHEVKDRKSIYFRKDKPKSLNGKDYHIISDYTFKKFFGEENEQEDNNNQDVQEEELEPNIKSTNRIDKKEYFCIDCGKVVAKQGGRCRSCAAKLQPRKIDNRPNREELKELIRNNSFVSIGKQYNVSDNAIRKWCDSYNLPRKVSEIKSYSEEDWSKI